MRALEAIGHREAFGFNWDPATWPGRAWTRSSSSASSADRIYHVDCKDTRIRRATAAAGILGSHLPWGDPRRGWDFVSTGHGDMPWEDAFRALDAIGYDGPISVEWEDTGMDRSTEPPRRSRYIRSLLWNLPEASFDAAFSNQ